MDSGQKCVNERMDEDNDDISVASSNEEESAGPGFKFFAKHYFPSELTDCRHLDYDLIRIGSAAVNFICHYVGVDRSLSNGPAAHRKKLYCEYVAARILQDTNSSSTARRQSRQQTKQVEQLLKYECGDQWANKKITLHGIIQNAVERILLKHIELEYFDIDKKFIRLSHYDERSQRYIKWLFTYVSHKLYNVCRNEPAKLRRTPPGLTPTLLSSTVVVHRSGLDTSDSNNDRTTNDGTNNDGTTNKSSFARSQKRRRHQSVEKGLSDHGVSTDICDADTAALHAELRRIQAEIDRRQSVLGGDSGSNDGDDDSGFNVPQVNDHDEDEDSHVDGEDELDMDGQQHIKRVRIEFDDGWYNGTVTEELGDHYHVVFEDGDERDFPADIVEQGITAYSKWMQITQEHQFVDVHWNLWRDCVYCKKINNSQRVRAKKQCNHPECQKKTFTSKQGKTRTGVFYCEKHEHIHHQHVHMYTLADGTLSDDVWK